MSICIHGFVFSFRTTFGVLLAPTVFRVVSTFSTIPTFNRILALVLALVLSVLSLLAFAFALATLASCLVCPCLCQMRQCPLGRLLLGVMDLSVSRFVLRVHSQYVLISSLKTPYEVNLARFNCTCFSRSANKASRELMRMSSVRLCAFPWASRRLQ